MRVHRRTSPTGEPAATRGTWLLVRQVVVCALKEFFTDGCTHLAASIAFRVLFSLFPLAMVVTAVFSLTSAAVGFRPDVIDAIVTSLPLTDDGRARLRALLEETAGLGAVGVVGAVGLVWAASGMMTAVRTALNLAWEVEDRRPWLVGKIVDLVFVLGAALGVAVSVALGLSVRLVHQLVAWAGLEGAATGLLVGSLAPFLLAFVVALTIYRFIPATHPRLRDLVAPGLLVATVFTLAQVLFALYLDRFARYSLVYGSFGVVIALMLFIYLAALVFLFGAELAAATSRVREDRSRGEGRDQPVRPLAEQVRKALKRLVVRADRSTSSGAGS